MGSVPLGSLSGAQHCAGSPGVLDIAPFVKMAVEANTPPEDQMANSSSSSPISPTARSELSRCKKWNRNIRKSRAMKKRGHVSCGPLLVPVGSKSDCCRCPPCFGALPSHSNPVTVAPLCSPRFRPVAPPVLQLRSSLMSARNPPRGPSLRALPRRWVSIDLISLRCPDHFLAASSERGLWPPAVGDPKRCP